MKMLAEKLRTELLIPADCILFRRYDSIETDGLSAKEMFQDLKDSLNPQEKLISFLTKFKKETDGKSS